MDRCTGMFLMSALWDMHAHVYAISPLLDLPLCIAYGVTKTATANPDLYFGLHQEYGSVQPGKVADLLLLEADPLLNIQNTQRIAAVVFDGNLYDRAALDALQAHVRKRARSWSVACKILWRFIGSPVSY